MDRYVPRFDLRVAVMFAVVALIVMLVYVWTRALLALIEPSVCAPSVGAGEPAYVQAVTCR